MSILNDLMKDNDADYINDKKKKETDLMDELVTAVKEKLQELAELIPEERTTETDEFKARLNEYRKYLDDQLVEYNKNADNYHGGLIEYFDQERKVFATYYTKLENEENELTVEKGTKEATRDEALEAAIAKLI